MQAASHITKTLSAPAIAIILAACGGSATVSSTPASSAAAAPASKPAAASSVGAVASAKPTASTAASAKPASSAAASGAVASAKPAASGSAAASAGASGLAGLNVPAPTAVTLDPASTAFLVLDFNAAVCQPRAACTGLLPKVADFLKKARDAKVTVVYSTTPAASGVSPVLSQIAPQSNEHTVAGHADKFIDTDLDSVLKKANAKTLLLSGGAYNGAVLYTGFHANALGYTVAVADDLSWSDSQAIDQLARFQLLNEPGYTNAANKPLAANQVTLTRTDLVTFK